MKQCTLNSSNKQGEEVCVYKYICICIYGITFWMAPRIDLFLKSLILSCWDLPFPIPTFFNTTDFLPTGEISHFRSTTPPVPEGLSQYSSLLTLFRRLLTTVNNLLPPPDSDPTSANFLKSSSEDFLGTCWTLPIEESIDLEREREREIIGKMLSEKLGKGWI